jgi:hypothetical protein
MGILVAGVVSVVVITAALWLAAVDWRRNGAHVMEYLGPC